MLNYVAALVTFSIKGWKNAWYDSLFRVLQNSFQGRLNGTFEWVFWMGLLNGSFEWDFWVGLLNGTFEWDFWVVLLNGLLNGTFENGTFEWDFWMGLLNGTFEWDFWVACVIKCHHKYLMISCTTYMLLVYLITYITTLSPVVLFIITVNIESKQCRENNQMVLQRAIQNIVEKQ